MRRRIASLLTAFSLMIGGLAVTGGPATGSDPIITPAPVYIDCTDWHCMN